jgi:hypothetical protein
MTDPRRYQDDEVAEIFEAAASPRQSAAGRALTSDAGLTLGELQAIGAEVGLPAERIARAAAEVELRRGALPRRTQLGMPVTVGRVVELPRAPTDHVWELLLSELRATFGANGRDRSQGAVRAWTNGRLHAYVEPSESGYRLRLGTTKSNAMALGGIGIASLMAGLLLIAVLLATHGPMDNLGLGAIMAVLGAALVGFNALRLPAWAQEREEQMAHLAARAQALIRADAPAPRSLAPAAPAADPGSAS